MIKMAFIDLSRTLIVGSGSNSGAEFLGKGETYRELYPQFQVGKVRIEELLTKTYACWQGLKVADLPKVYDTLVFHPHARETVSALSKMGIHTVLLTNVPTHLAQLIKARLHMDDSTGTVLEICDGAFTGKVLEFHDNKFIEAMNALHRFGIKADEAVAIGDRSDDARLFRQLKFGIAYEGDKEALAAAKYRISDWRDVQRILKR